MFLQAEAPPKPKPLPNRNRVRQHWLALQLLRAAPRGLGLAGWEIRSEKRTFETPAGLLKAVVMPTPRIAMARDFGIDWVTMGRHDDLYGGRRVKALGQGNGDPSPPYYR